MRTRPFLLALIFVGQTSAAFAADWTDPLEQAFTVDVPQGWTVKGGLFRLGYSDTRPMIDLTSPDGRINVRLGDVAVPTYFVPNQLHPMEGDVYDLGAQAQMTVARLRSGQEYATLYATTRFKGACSNPVARQPEAGALLQELPEETPSLKSSSGQAAFRCESNRGDSNRVTYVYATTSLYQGFWIVRTLASYIAPADQAALARSIIARASASFKISPQWRERQKKMDADALVYQQARQQQRMRALSQQVAQFEMTMQNMRNQVSAFERQQDKQARQVEEVGNILTGITPTIDPLGNRRDVFTGPKSRYWTDLTGRTVNSDTPPGPGWKELTPVK